LTKGEKEDLHLRARDVLKEHQALGKFKGPFNFSSQWIFCPRMLGNYYYKRDDEKEEKPTLKAKLRPS